MNRVLSPILALLIASAANAQTEDELLGTWACVPDARFQSPRKVMYVRGGKFILEQTLSSGHTVYTTGPFKTNGRFLVQDEGGEKWIKDGKVTANWYNEPPMPEASKTRYRSWGFTIEKLNQAELILQLTNVTLGPGMPLSDQRGRSQPTTCQRAKPDSKLVQLLEEVPPYIHARFGLTDSVEDRAAGRTMAPKPDPRAAAPAQPKVEYKDIQEAEFAAVNSINHLKALIDSYRRNPPRGCESSASLLQTSLNGAYSALAATENMGLSQNRLALLRTAKRNADIGAGLLKGTTCER